MEKKCSEIEDSRATCVLFVGRARNPPAVTESCPVLTWEEIGEGEVLVKITRACICSLDLKLLDGYQDGTDFNPQGPSILGHEGCGRVLASKKSGFERGDRVVFGRDDLCGCCELCRGVNTIHKSIIRYGIRGTCHGRGLSGTFSTHMLIRRGTPLVHLPANIPDEVAALSNCTVTTVLTALKKALRNHNGVCKTAYVQGAGLFGILSCALLSHQGLTVYCRDVAYHRQKMALKFGAEETQREAESRGNTACSVDEFVDVAVEASGAPRSAADLINVIRPGGIAVLLKSSCGYIPVSTIVQRGITVIGCGEYCDADLKEAVEFLSATVDKYPYQKLFSPPFSLNEFQSALQVARSRSYHRVVFCP